MLEPRHLPTRGCRSLRRSRGRRWGPGALAVLLAACLAGSARAQNAEQPSPPGGADEDKEETTEEETTPLGKLSIEELLQVPVSPFHVSTRLDKGYRASNSVSGSRIDTPIRELPFALQAFTEALINDQQPRTVFDVAKYSPGVTYRSNDFNEGNANLAIRGFAISNTPGNVQLLRDGFHGPSILDFTNIARLEVVKGPASFLYGQLAPGGVVNVVTKSPLSEFTALARLTYGSYESYRFDGDVTGPITERLFYRLATAYDEDIHYWKPYDAHAFDIAPSLLWKPTDRLSLTLKYEAFLKREDPQVMQKPGYSAQAGVLPTPSDPNLDGVPVPGLPDNWNSMSFPDFRNSTTSNLTASLDYAADDHWNLRAGWSHLYYDIDALFSGNFGMADNFTVLQGRRFRSTDYTNHDDTVEAEAVGRYRFGGMSLRLLLGGQLVWRSFDNVAGQAPNDPAFGNHPASPLPLWDLHDPSTWNRVVTIPLSALTEGRTDQTTDFADQAIYGGATFGFLGDRLRVLAGWRLTWTSSQRTDRLTHQKQPRFTAHEVTPQYGVLYEATRGVALFASYSESFVPGSQILLVRNVPTTPAVPTQGRGGDVGVKADLLEGRISGTVSLFAIEERNIVNDVAQLDPATGVQIFTNVQSGRQRSRGVELDLLLSPYPHWQTYLSYSYMDARIVEFSGRDAAVLASDPATLDPAGQALFRLVHLFHDAPLQMSAPHLANLWTRYDFLHGPLTGLHLAGGVNVVIDQTLLPDTPTFAHQSYALVNATIGYAREWWRGHPMDLEVIGKNLAGAHYRPSQSTRSRPRELAVSLTTTF